MKCKICDAVSKKTYEKLNGYIDQSFYDLYECSDCKTSFCDPMESSSFVYESIYKQADKIPGYNRYAVYAAKVLKEKNPLDFLAASESMYWAIKKSLENNFPKKENIKILEIGSGLGYTTYALNKSGYDCKGIDISQNAVDRAIEKFGSYYIAGDIFKESDKYAGKYDAVIMTELIEHVESPLDFIKESFKFLKEGGKLIITTPNKSFYPEGTVWRSDVAPVHLYWMGEDSFVKIADILNKKVSFLDFSEFNSLYNCDTSRLKNYNLKNVTNLNKDGTPRKPNSSRLKSFIKMIFPRHVFKLINNFLYPSLEKSKTTTLCAQLDV